MIDPSLLFDCHSHTELAYCNNGITAVDSVARARELGLAGLCITEHAPQLYCAEQDFWDARHLSAPRETWRTGEHSRMETYRAIVEPLRGPSVRVGLEVELDGEGCPTLHERDREWADLILGAVHWLPRADEDAPDEAWNAVFRETTAGLLDAGVDVLAHPLRVFQSWKREVPPSLKPWLADRLAETGTAAEVNFHHTSRPDREFFRCCAERGVKIALSSDAHATEQVGDFARHFDFLARSVGRDADWEEILYRPEPCGETAPR